MQQVTPRLTHHTKSRRTDMKTAKLGWTTLAISNFIPCKKELLLYLVTMFTSCVSFIFLYYKNKFKLGLAGLEQYNVHTIFLS